VGTGVRGFDSSSGIPDLVFLSPAGGARIGSRAGLIGLGAPRSWAMKRSAGHRGEGTSRHRLGFFFRFQIRAMKRSAGHRGEGTSRHRLGVVFFRFQINGSGRDAPGFIGSGSWGCCIDR
jgi:hypothetical protein